MSLLATLAIAAAPALISGIGGVIQAKKNREYNELQQDKANEYNSIGAQLQRARDAGVNPNSILGNGYSPAQMTPLQASDQTNVITQLSNLLSTLSQDIQTSVQAENMQVDTDQKKVDLTFSKMTIEQRYKALVNMNSRSEAEIKKIFSDIGMNEFSKEMQEKTYMWFASKSETEIKLMLEQLNLLRNQSLDILKGIDVKNAEIKKIFSSIRLQDRQTKFYDTQEAGVESDIRLQDRQTKFYDTQEAGVESDIALKGKQSSFIESQTKGQDIENAIQEIVKQFSDATDIPIGATESEALFMLWKEGRFADFCKRLSVIAVENGAKNILPKIQDAFNKSLDNMQKGGLELFKSFYTR